MQGGIFQVCFFVTAAILNRPFLFPKENATIPERDEEIITRMKEHEKAYEMERARLEQEAAKMNQAEEKPVVEDFNQSWDFWSAVSLVTFLMIEIWRQDFQDGNNQDSSSEEEDYLSFGNVAKKMILPDKGVLASFHDSCIGVSGTEFWRMREFVESFADDLLEALRSTCNRDADMEVEDCIGIGSMYENWKVGKPMLCDLIVPFTPPEPYRFTFEHWCSPGNDVPPTWQGCGRIKIVNANEDKLDCLCGRTNLGEDMLCLLHSKAEKVKTKNTTDDLLCSKDTTYLAKDQVMKWFQISITKAWNQISHKHKFDLTFHSLDSPGAIKVKFQSGKVIVFNITPVVQYEDTDAYLLSHFESSNNNLSDIYWPMTFAVYEKNLFKFFAKNLPSNSCHLSCLQIVAFLHKKQCSLTGKSGLTSYHLKTTLLHLLLSKLPAEWHSDQLQKRLRDILMFLEKSLQEKKLYHVLIGNHKVPKWLNIPTVFREAEPLNLLRPLLLKGDLYVKTVDTFQEMLKNAPVLIQEYMPHFPNGITHLQ
ncbi:inositol 1,4,5-trisphosphate receptor-interacting protein-like [Polypterus senegalus]|nr:inositol 1,4,5-trisphosphate receptor-interacting protein-like [Polypterus senegalus]